MGTDQARLTFDALCNIFVRKFETFIPSAQMPGREEGRRDCENEPEQGRASQQLVLPTPGGVNQDAPVSSWSLIFLVYGGCLVRAEAQEDQASKEIEREDHPDHQDELPLMRKRMTMWEEWCLK